MEPASGTGAITEMWDANPPGRKSTSGRVSAGTRAQAILHVGNLIGHASLDDAVRDRELSVALLAVALLQASA